MRDCVSFIFNMFERIISLAIDSRENYLRKHCACDWRSSRNFDADCALRRSSLRRPTAAEGRRLVKADSGRRPTRRIARTSCRKYLNTLRAARRGAARDLKSRLRAARPRAPDYLNRNCGLRGVASNIWIAIFCSMGLNWLKFVD